MEGWQEVEPSATRTKKMMAWMFIVGTECQRWEWRAWKGGVEKDEFEKDEFGKDEWKRRIFRRWRRCTVKIESESRMIWKDKETKERREESSYISMASGRPTEFTHVSLAVFLAVTRLAVGTWTARYCLILSDCLIRGLVLDHLAASPPLTRYG